MPQANSRRLAAVANLLDSWTSEGHCRAVAAETGAAGLQHSFARGRLGDEHQSVCRDDSIFLIASPTKPIVATACLMLVEQGALQLDHAAARYVPEFRGNGKENVRIINLLTHTSGLPDMAPNNQQLRQDHAPLSEFLKAICELELSFAPGARVSYQSTGFLVLATILERVTGQSLCDFLNQNLFEPLGMLDTALGAPDSWRGDGRWERMAWCQIEDRPGAADWGWNSQYWRRLGAPWGGLLSTVRDLGRLCQHWVGIHQGEPGVLARRTLELMTTNRLTGLRRVREAEAMPWGLGWQLNWPGHPRGFGSLLGSHAYGHWGATGTMLWIDPREGLYGVVLTTEPVAPENRRPIAFGNLASLVWQ